MFHRLYGEIIIVFLVGVLFAGSLHYFFSQYHRSRVHVAEKSPNAKQQSYTIHEQAISSAQKTSAVEIYNRNWQ